MKLELKHLAPYLPYGLKVEMLDFDIMTKLMGIEDANEEMRIQELVELTVGKRLELMYKPILRPLSDLTEDSELFKDYDVFIPPTNYLDVQCHNYDIAQRLFENHYDVFGLIPEELAIDINNLKK